VGAPGTIPTNWAEGLSGLTREVVAIGTENGVNYIDLKFSGTATSTIVEVRYDLSTSIVATNGQTWTASSFLKTISAPNPPLAFQSLIVESTDVGAFVAGGTQNLTVTSTLTRFSHTRTLSGGGTVARVISANRFTLTNGATYDFTVRIGWPQMELGSVATSPIVTTAGTASRVADAITLTSASSLIGQTGGGTMFVEVDWRATPNVQQQLITVSNNTSQNRVLITGSTTSIFMAIIANNVVQTDQGESYTGYSGIQKFAMRYATNDAKLYRNGSAISTDTVVDLSALATLTDVNIGSRFDEVSQANMWIRSVALFPTPLTDAQLASITTL